MIGNILECGVVDSSKGSTIYDKARIVKAKLIEIFNKYTHHSNETQCKWVIGIEEFLKGFGAGNYRTHDLFTLAQMNSLVSYDCINVFDGTVPLRVHPTSARNFFGLKKHLITDNIKSIVFEHVKENYLKDYQWRITRTGNLHKSNYDITDSVIIAKYALSNASLLQGKQNTKKKKVSNSNTTKSKRKTKAVKQ
jgi:hypothetical protein